MIVRPAPDRLQLITQPDHAQVARAIMERSVPLEAHPRRDTILHAIAEHDNGWEEEDAAPRVNPATGEVFDFMTAPADVRQHVWPRGVARVAANPWAAALIAQHAIVIYDRYSADPEWAPFFAQLERARADMLAASGLPLADLLADYEFVRLADLISLTFCTGWSDEQRTSGWRIQLTGARVLVSPDVFGGAEIPFEIAAREIRRQPFPSDVALRDAWRAAPTTTLGGTAVGG